MEKTQQLDAKDVTRIKEMRDEYAKLGTKSVQLTITKQEIQKQLDTINTQIVDLETAIGTLFNEEQTLAQELQKKYGAGVLDLESNTFTKGE
jgi:chromosome segregation ATPase